MLPFWWTQNHLCHKLPLLLGEALPLEYREQTQVAEDGNELPLGKEALSALIVLADTFRRSLDKTLFKRSVSP
ncbi:MAG: hypothetical protein U1E74_04700 [Paenacidovorax caeni]